MAESGEKVPLIQPGLAIAVLSRSAAMVAVVVVVANGDVQDIPPLPVAFGSTESR